MEWIKMLKECDLTDVTYGLMLLFFLSCEISMWILEGFYASIQMWGGGGDVMYADYASMVVHYLFSC